MSMFPHTVTVYYEYEDELLMTEVHSTVLKGVLVDAVKGAQIAAGGAEPADEVTVYIPHDVRAWDGLTLLEKRFAKPKEYAASADKSALWTLDVERGYMVKGEVVTEEGYRAVSAKYDDVWRITRVDDKDFGNLRHFEVGGR